VCVCVCVCVWEHYLYLEFTSAWWSQGMTHVNVICGKYTPGESRIQNKLQWLIDTGQTWQTNVYNPYMEFNLFVSCQNDRYLTDRTDLLKIVI
jgi:hypothetical protein